MFLEMKTHLQELINVFTIKKNPHTSEICSQVRHFSFTLQSKFGLYDTTPEITSTTGAVIFPCDLNHKPVKNQGKQVRGLRGTLQQIESRVLLNYFASLCFLNKCSNYWITWLALSLIHLLS